MKVYMRSILLPLAGFAALILYGSSDLCAEGKGVKVEGPVFDKAKGVQILQVESPYTGGKNRVEVLLPDKIEDGKKYPVLYVLPVGGDFGGKYGDQVQEVKKTNAHNRYGLIVVSMAFDSVPWYGSHMSDPKKRHEEYILKVIVPLIEERFPASPKKEDRLLLGFSKAGWGAVSLLLRNLDFFGAACSWDAPLAFKSKDYGKVGTRKHFGSAEQMEKYRPMALAEKHAAELKGKRARLTILGRSIWWKHSGNFSQYLTKLGVPHKFDDSLKFKHTWDSGWVPKALDMFLPQYLKERE